MFVAPEPFAVSCFAGGALAMTSRGFCTDASLVGGDFVVDEAAALFFLRELELEVAAEDLEGSLRIT